MNLCLWHLVTYELATHFSSVIKKKSGERGGDGVVEGGLITPALKPDPVL